MGTCSPCVFVDNCHLRFDDCECSKTTVMPKNCCECQLCGICRNEVPYGSEICKKALGVE